MLLGGADGRGGPAVASTEQQLQQDLAQAVAVSGEQRAAASSSQPGPGEEQQRALTKSPGAARDSAQGRAIADLPDLTSHLQSLGLYGEYQRFRDGYMKWRQGAAQGARGEASADAFAATQLRDFEEWCPTFTVWKWRRTISYWVTVSFFEGSLLFLASSCFACSPWHGPWPSGQKVERTLIAWPYLIGGCFFQLGSYFMCLEVVNLRNHGHTDFWPFARADTLARLAAVKVSKNPYRLAVAYFFGCAVYNIPLVVAVLEVTMSGPLDIALCKIPYMVGGVLFAAGGIFECIENQVFTSKPDSLSKWAAAMNGTGGVLFFLASIVNWWSDWWCSFMYAVGSANFAIGSTLGLFMWQDEQFGLSFLVALNSAARKSRASRDSGRPSGSRELSQEQRFSGRSIFFILFYCTVAVLVVYNSGLMMELAYSEHSWRSTNVYNEVLPFFLMHMVLLMHSAVVQTPSRNNQPFHMLVMATRFLTLTTGINAFCTFLCWLPDITKLPGADHPQSELLALNQEPLSNLASFTLLA